MLILYECICILCRAWHIAAQHGTHRNPTNTAQAERSARTDAKTACRRARRLRVHDWPTRVRKIAFQARVSACVSVSAHAAQQQRLICTIEKAPFLGLKFTCSSCADLYAYSYPSPSFVVDDAFFLHASSAKKKPRCEARPNH